MLVRVYGQDAVSKECVYDWFARFHAGKKSVEDAFGQAIHTSRTAENIEHVRVLWAKHRWLTLWLIAEEVGISKDTVVAIVREDLGKRKIRFQDSWSCDSYSEHGSKKGFF